MLYVISKTMKLQNNCSAKQRQNRLNAEQHDFTDQRLNQILYVRLLSTVYMFYVRSFKYSSSLKRCFLWSLLEKLQFSWIYCTAHRFIQLSSDGPKHLNIRCVELTQTRFVALQTETRTKLQTHVDDKKGLYHSCAPEVHNFKGILVHTRTPMWPL